MSNSPMTHNTVRDAVSVDQAERLRKGQLLIDIAAQMITHCDHEVPQLLTCTSHQHHRMAIYVAVLHDNVAIVKHIVPTNDAPNAAPNDATNDAVKCCAVYRDKVLEVLCVDQYNSLTMTCVEYDSIDCFKYLHKKTREGLDVVITKAIRYGAEKILNFLAATTEHSENIITQARRAGLQLRICV